MEILDRRAHLGASTAPVQVERTEAVQAVSDHFPLVVEVDL